MTDAIDKPSFESVYLLTQRNAEAIQQLGERLDDMARREEQRRISEAAAAARREEERKAEEAKRRDELAKTLRDSRRRINKLDELFTSQWGKLVEALVDGKVVQILNERGIKVEQTNQRSVGFYDGKKQEIDILAINGDEIVAIEVKTTLRPEDIKVFEDKLKVLKLWMRQYAGEKVYGAVAYIRADAGSAELATKRGLFTIKAVGSSAYLTNAEDFKPRSF